MKVAAVGFINDGQAMEPVPPLSISEVMLRQSGTLINAATILVVAALLIWFGLRPALRAILATPAAEQAEVAALERAANPAIAAAAAPAEAALAPPSPAEAAALAPPAVASMIEDMAQTMAQTADRSAQKRLEQMIDLDEEQVASILKRWLMREEATA